MATLLVTQIATFALAAERAHALAATEGYDWMVVKTPYEFQVAPAVQSWIVGPSSQIVYVALAH